MTEGPNSTKTNHSALISPEQAALVIIDELAKIDESPSDGTWWAGRPYAQLMKLAQLFRVPHIAYFVVNAPSSPDSSAHPSVSEGTIISTHIDPWREPLFEKAVNDMGRSNFLISGYCTQGGVTFAVLNALARGYDVAHVADAASGLSSTEACLAIKRMNQAGAVPLSWRQLALEWQMDWADTGTRERLIQLITS